MNIRQLRVSARIGLIVALAALGLVGSSVLAVRSLRSEMLDDHRKSVSYILDAARHIVLHWERQAASGAISEQEAKRLATETLRQMQFNDGEYVFIWDNKGIAVLLPSNPKAEGSNILGMQDPNGVRVFERLSEVAERGQGEFVRYVWAKAGNTDPQPKLSMAVSFREWNWAIGSGIYLDGMEKEIDAAVFRLLAGIVAVLVVIVGAAFVILRSIVGPLTRLTNRMQRLANDDLTIEIEGTGYRDELGEMARALQVFKDNASAKRQLEDEQKQTEARLVLERRNASLALADSFESQVKGIVQSVSSQATELQATAGSLTSMAEQASDQSATVAKAATSASANVQTVASAAEELASSVNEISRQVTQSASMSQNAVDEAQRANSIVGNLAVAAEKIGEVVNLITNIASKTNLLALNATIEAARAGDAGKGFAVVAGEVKLLATQTAKATKDIGQQVTGIQNATREAVRAIETVTGNITAINQTTSAIAAAVEEQGAATQEIARNVQQAATGTNEVTVNIVGLQQTSSETGNSAELLLSAAGDLSRQAESLTSHVDLFIQDIRKG
ncbi:cache domain-containing protein [Telmatospirillum sp.]|uniref:methyl-accepting chemotaxis protein n=1 Tax=Telmatospirillum sp. TaxID=2079197 RepID=UPI0028510E2E|nr:cache domain-containing protein [Telmatospirillum sp.]MDR3435374.1 cache domain-containing protein [Telmatospirillum sp.]